MTAHRTLFPLFLLALCPAVVVAAAEVESLVREGVRLHDAGDYDGAIASFERALDADPDNAVARYELANTYFASGDYRACIEAAKEGLERESDLKGAFYALAGSCHSTLGAPERAVELFRKGLEVDPNNSMLQFNVGVTLAGQGDIEAAIDHFESAAANRPGYASPHFALGELHQQASAPVRSLFYFMRFVTLEPNTERTVQASEAVFDLFFSGIEVRSEREITLSVPTEGEHDPLASLELSRTMAAASTYVDDVDEADAESAADAEASEGGSEKGADEGPKTEAGRKVEALVTFLQIALELGAEPTLAETTVWNLAIAPLLEIHVEGGSEALAYLMAARAGIPGGQSWLEAHPGEIDELGGLLRRISDR